jgi:hypothetical protein
LRPGNIQCSLVAALAHSCISVATPSR